MSASMNSLCAEIIKPIKKDIDIKGLSLNSKEVKKGDLFLALAGSKTHGNKYIQEAIDNGAVAILIEKTANINKQKFSVPCKSVKNLRKKISLIASRFYGNDCRHLNTIAVTGTNGKSSIAYGIKDILNNNNATTGVIGTLGYGVDKLNYSKHTTPDAISTQAIIANFHKQNIVNLAIEASSHGLDQGRIEAVDVDTAIYTNLSHDHLDYHQNLTNYQKAKQKLFEKPSVKNAVINVNDKFGQHLAHIFADKLRIISYGLNIAHKGEFLSAENLSINHQGWDFNLLSSWGNANLKIKLLGSFNVENVLAMLAAFLLVGGDFLKVPQVALDIKPLKGRMECFGGTDQQPLVVVDFAHTPDALAQSLKALRQHMIASAKLFCVFGCGGNRDQAKRPIMAEVAQEYADFVIVTDDNPRNEPKEEIISHIIEGFSDKSKVTIIHERKKAISTAIETAQSDDVVLIAGKGHESVQIIGDKEFQFSDQHEVQNILC